MRYACHFLLLLLFALPAAAQTDPSLVGTCATGTAEAYLDVNNVRARLVNTGVLFYRGSPDVYEVPKGTGLKVIFSDALWIGGMVDNELRVAAATYGPYDFWPGPISDPGQPPTDCARYDHIWSVDRSIDISNFEDGEYPTPVELNWPADLGAPYQDVDGLPGYNPRAGEKPSILGDQMHWWVMNDAGNEKTRTDSKPLGIEVRVSAFGFDSIPDLENVTFYQYKVINRNTVPIRDIWMGKYQDVDLGAAFDDYIGSDSTLSLVFAYNADNDDDGQYGAAPPAIGVSTIQASHSKKSLPSDRDSDNGDFMTNAMVSYKNGSYGDPSSAEGYYFFLQSKWKIGQPLTLGGRGFDPPSTANPITKYAFSGDPASQSFWSENNIDNQGTSQAPADRRMISSFGPFDLDPDESVTFTYAYIWARGSSNLNSVTKLKELARRIHTAKESILQPSFGGFEKFVDGNPPERPQQSFWLDPVYPNPSSGSATVKYSLSLDGNTEIAVFDVLSREVVTLHTGLQTAGPHEASFDTSNFPPGVYTIRLQSNRNSTSRLLTVVL